MFTSLKAALCAGLLCAMAAPGAAQALTIGDANIQWTFWIGAPETLVDSFDLTPGVPYAAHASGFNITCFEEDCANYRFGGASGRADWRVDLQPSTLAFDFSGFQGSDDGGAAADTWDLFVTYSSPRPFQIRLHRMESASSVICGDCTHTFSSYAETWQDGDTWLGAISVSGAAAVTNGDQTLHQQVFARVTEVPEPSGWLLMILGVGLVGRALRRRRAAHRPQVVVR